jgi:WD40 repeat protein
VIVGQRSDEPENAINCPVAVLFGFHTPLLPAQELAVEFIAIKASGPVWCLAFSDDGKTLAYAGGELDFSINLWDVSHAAAQVLEIQPRMDADPRGYCKTPPAKIRVHPRPSAASSQSPSGTSLRESKCWSE